MNSQPQKILVYGANGAQGSPVVKKLVQKGYQVRVLVRDRDKAQAVFPHSVEIVEGSLEDEDSLKLANEGIDRVSLVLPLEYRSTLAITKGSNAINAARDAGVQLLVFNTSTSIPQQITDAAAFEIKRNLENYLQASGVPSIILRPPVYMDNLAAPWSLPSIHQGVVAYPLPSHIKVSWISLDDTAALTVAALEHPELAGETFDIAGPEALNGQEIAEKFTKVLDRSFSYQEIPLDGFEQGLNQAFGEPTGTEITKIYRWRANHPDEGEVNVDAVLQKLPVNLTTFEQWLQMTDWNTSSV
jgi:NAD(P)H dehydrogenase (quinone)